MSWILGNLKLIGILAAITALLGAGGYVGKEIEKRYAERELKALEATLTAQCEKDKAITTEASKTYEANITALNKRISALRMQPASCVPVTSPTPGHNAAPGAGQLSGAHGVTDQSLFDFAGDAETDRLKLIACQGFVQRVWKR